MPKKRTPRDKDSQLFLDMGEGDGGQGGAGATDRPVKKKASKKTARRPRAKKAGAGPPDAGKPPGAGGDGEGNGGGDTDGNGVGGGNGAHDVEHVDEMYSAWFLDYASYVILERAVPAVEDGLKPVQRRILHTMRELEDGRYHKVANIIGQTMQFHPHGDASIGDALVNLGQKNLLVDTQGNWGNLYTGDNAAAPRYIEARLTKFALEVVFNPKTTTWAKSYDGRKKEPVTLPVKFPLVLAQGAEGIAVGLATKILPHNFIELIDACIAALRKEKFPLVPDFPTGGIMDASDYNDGQRGGRVRVRARIEVVKRKLLRVTEIPFGTTTSGLMDSIVAANEKDKIKVAKIEDRTAENVDILVHLPAGSDPDTAIGGLYAFTDCEVSLPPNTCVIAGDEPLFIPVSELLKRCALQTKDLLQLELEIRLGELHEKWHFSSLEKIFIEKRIYRDIEECTTWEAVIEAIARGLDPYRKLFLREITEEDIVRLTEIKIKRISKYDAFKADEAIRRLEEDIDETKKNLGQLTRYAIRYFKNLKEKYGAGRERRTEISADPFDRVVASAVAVASETLYVDRKEGFAGWGMKKDAEAVDKCSKLDDVIAFLRDGTMSVSKVAEKNFVGKNVVHIDVFHKDAPVTYFMVYRDGRDGRTFAKKFQVSGVTRDKPYDLAQGKPGTRVLYLTAADDPEANPKVLVHHKAVPRIKKTLEFDFAELALKGRGSKGNIVTKHPVDRVVRAPRPAEEE